MGSEDTKLKRHYGRFLLTAFVAGLTFVPMDLVTSILWLIGAAAALWSVIQLMVSGVELLARDRIHWPTAVIAPLLTIFCFAVTIPAMRYSFGVAERFSAKASKEIQSRCQSGTCPAVLSGWQADESGCEMQTRVGFFTRYYVCYSRSDNNQSFQLRLRRDIDSSIVWTGGKGLDLQRQGFGR